jgi:SAM-dependent methyltransferase
MQEYTGFAQVYDIFMDNVPYDAWAQYLAGLLGEYGVTGGLVLELGCGTGSITRRLANKGYDMIGIDNSEEMLEIARFKEYETTEELLDKNDSILYLEQDMRDFELYGTVSAVVSICDSINYITSNTDLLTVFRLVNNYLDPGGIFIFDMNTQYKYKYILGDHTIAENRDNCSFIWDNYYDEESGLNEYDVTIFVKLDDETEYGQEENYDGIEEDEKAEIAETDEKAEIAETDEKAEIAESEEDDAPALYERYQETHYQKAYSIDTVKQLLEEAGMEFIAVYDAFTHNAPHEKSERVYFVVKEKYQQNKWYENPKE